MAANTGAGADAAPDAEEALSAFLLSMADDDFVIGHRLSDWVGAGPTMEEDNSLASISQDEMGHARLWYEVLGDLDDLALNRSPVERRNSTLVESKHDDYADVIAIGYLYHEAEARLLSTIRDGDDADLAGRAEQALNEEPYHREHSTVWLERLVATDEGRRRLERAFEDALPRAADMFGHDEAVVGRLLADGVLARDPADLREDWVQTVRDHLAGLPLNVDDEALAALDRVPSTNGRAGEHTAAMDELLDEIHAGPLVGDHAVLRYDP